MQRTNDKRVGLLVWGDRRPGGAERRFFRLFEHLRRTGYPIRLYTSESGIEACKSLGIHLDMNDVYVFTEPDQFRGRLFSYFALIANVVKLVRQLRHDRIEHVHFGENPGPLSFVYGLLTAVACPFSVSLVNSTRDYQRSARQRFYMTAIAKSCTHIDCLSTQIRTDLLAFLGEGFARKCLVSPCSFTDPQAAAIVSQEGSHVRDIDIALISRFTRGKGHFLLKDALIELARAGRTGLIVHICGSGPLEAEIRAAFESVPQQQLEIHFEPEPFRILRRAKVYVSLQDLENYPSQSLLEAMLSECAVVATDVGLTRQLLDESCARLVPREPAALAAALVGLLDHPEQRAMLGHEAAKRVLATHTVERFSDYFLAEVFGGASRRGIA